MDPVHAGLVRYESLLDGTVGIEDLSRLHDSMAVKAENQYRYEEAIK